MLVDEEKCTGCEACHPYCPVMAIETKDGAKGLVSCIDQDRCVECGVCLRANVCPVDAIYMPELGWPRAVRAAFSNPLAPHRETRELGRGTEEMKTNDVTGLFPRGVAGVAVEMGRPGAGTSLSDVQLMTMALAKRGVRFAPQNPVTNLMVDIKKGQLESEILTERVLSAIIEFSVGMDRLQEVLNTIKQVAAMIRTVFSLDVISRVSDDGAIPVLPIIKTAGLAARPNAKTNLGLGRPLKEEA
jgi:NAD-dependent dihydropyrimidine dehydrogenase PreA subunit